MKVGVVGKPNIGKSSFFRALTLAKAESANYPFTTIDANIGIGFLKLKDPALDFAYKLHTDFGKNFIRAINVKTKLPIGKDAILKN